MMPGISLLYNGAVVIKCGLYWKSSFSKEELESMLPEGLPQGMVTEFEESMRPALLIRQSFLDLRDNYKRIVDPLMYPTTKSTVL